MKGHYTAAAAACRAESRCRPTRARINSTASIINPSRTEAYADAWPYSPTRARPTMLTVAMPNRRLVVTSRKANHATRMFPGQASSIGGALNARI